MRIKSITDGKTVRCHGDKSQISTWTKLQKTEEEEELDGELGQGLNKARHANHSQLKKHLVYNCGQEKNGILPWDNRVKRRECSRKNKCAQRSLEAKHETILPFYRSGVSNSFLLLIEDNDEDFETEVSLFNDLSVSSDLVFSPQYLPYYRSYEEFFIKPVSMSTFLIQAEVEEGDIEREKREGGSGCKVNTIKEDESPNNLVISTGYFPYYRSYEDHLGHRALYDGLSTMAEGKTNTESKEKEDACEVVVACSDNSIPQSLESEKEAISSIPGVEPSGSLLLTNSIAENCGSEIALFNGLSIMNQPFSSTGYFPYYRTYGELLVSPSSHDGYSTSIDVGSETSGKGKSRWDFSTSCALC